MGKRKRKVAGVRYTHDEITGNSNDHAKEQKEYDPTSYDFDIDCLTYLPLKMPLICKLGYSFSKESAMQWCKDHVTHPFDEKESFKVEDLVSLHFTVNSKGETIDPITEKVLSPRFKIALNRKSKNVYDYSTIVEFNLKDNLMMDLLSGEEFTEDDIVIIHDPDRKRDLPLIPLIQRSVETHESDIVKNSNKFISSLNLKKTGIDNEENTWYLARPTTDSFYAATLFKQKQWKMKPIVIVTTTKGDFTIELDIDYCTLGVINFIGKILNGSFFNVKILKIRTNEWMEIGINGTIDETVWKNSIAYERDIARKDYKYPVFIINKENKQIHITKSSQIAVACTPLSINDFHIIGGVVGGEGIVSSICNEKVYANGKPVSEIMVRNITIVNNPLPLEPPVKK